MPSRIRLKSSHRNPFAKPEKPKRQPVKPQQDRERVPPPKKRPR